MLVSLWSRDKTAEPVGRVLKELDAVDVEEYGVGRE